MRILGARFGINTIYGIVISSLFFIVLQALIKQPLVKDEFMAALIGGGLSGIGVAISKETDDQAFISVAKVMGVFGQNFEDIKL